VQLSRNAMSYREVSKWFTTPIVASAAFKLSGGQRQPVSRSIGRLLADRASDP